MCLNDGELKFANQYKRWHEFDECSMSVRMCTMSFFKWSVCFNTGINVFFFYEVNVCFIASAQLKANVHMAFKYAKLDKLEKLNK